MSRPDRPYRATYVGPRRTTHYDYPTKEERELMDGRSDSRTTVTSRKPLRRGEPVCWVNVYSDGYPASHRTKAYADGAAAGLSRLHCIPVYLPGEVRTEERDAALTEVAQLQAKAELLTKELEDEHRSHGLTLEQYTAAAAERDTARAEVARLTAELADLRLIQVELRDLRSIAAAAWLVYEPGAKLERALGLYVAKYGKPKEQP